MNLESASPGRSSSGLSALHLASVVHGDRYNVLLFSDPIDESVLISKISDFGYTATNASINQRRRHKRNTEFQCTNSAPADMEVFATNLAKTPIHSGF